MPNEFFQKINKILNQIFGDLVETQPDKPAQENRTAPKAPEIKPVQPKPLQETPKAKAKSKAKPAKTPTKIEPPQNPTVTGAASVAVPPPSRTQPPAKAQPPQTRKQEPQSRSEPKTSTSPPPLRDATYTPPEPVGEASPPVGVPPMRLPLPPHSKIEEVQRKIREKTEGKSLETADETDKLKKTSKIDKNTQKPR